MLQLLSTVSPGILGNCLCVLAKKSGLRPWHKADYRLRSYGLPLMMVLALGVMLRVEAWAQPAGWQYYSRISITENSGLNVANYQLLLTLNTQDLVTAGQINANGDDIRFGADLNGTTLFSYWIESGMNTSNTKIWVKIPFLAANAVTDIYLFYGNNSASAESNIDGTFIGPHSSTDSIASGSSGGSTNSQRGFRFAPNEDILVKRFGKREPNGSTRYVTLFDFNSQAILRQHQVTGPAGQYIYSDLGSPIWLTQGTQYLLELYQGSSDGYYFGVSSQIGTHLTYYDMRYCNSCTQNTFPTLILNGYQYGYPDFHYYTKNNVASPPTYSICPAEICNGIDDNCDGNVDEGVQTIYYRDFDTDGFGNPSSVISACSQPSGYVTNDMDCNDLNPVEKPGQSWYKDTDGDGYAQTGAATITQCTRPVGYKAASELTSTTGDCNDNNATVKPGATEVCDGLDNNCDGTIDNIPSGGGVWQNANVGTANGNATYPPCDAQPNDVFTIQASSFSTSISDQLHLVYQQLCGNVELIAHVTGVNNGGWAGITLRETLMPGSKKVALKTQFSNNIRREIRTTTNAAASILNLSRTHTWLRLVRNGSNFVGYTSTNGVTWDFAFSTTVTMTSCIYVGLFSESINANVVTTATFDNVQINGGVLPLIQAPQTPVAASNLSPEVYPNPTTGEVNIDLSSYANPVGTVKVFDAYGKLVMQRQLDGSHLFGMKIDRADGVYFLSIEVEGEAPVTKRVVVAH
ncbi:MAG: DUF2341 domain-containing protein [Saprospiraceae bacterium]